jgi:hypothetical protein
LSRVASKKVSNENYALVTGLPFRITKQEVLDLFKGIDYSSSDSFVLSNTSGDAYIKLNRLSNFFFKIFILKL